MRTDWQSTRDAVQEEQIVAWRRGRLLEAGFGFDLADALAGEFRVDLHALLELVERGCPPVLAARILSPVDGEGAHR
ncbi:hypothetical protein [Geodermatophilus sp. URMC 64]